MRPVLVVGGGLAGLAAALRLAKAGHPVHLWEAGDRLGGRYAASDWSGILVDDAPAVVGFPAPWRDLFRKSGRTLEAELARTGCALEAAAPARYEFADGSSLSLPSDRGEQYTVLTGAYGEQIATRWRDLVDWLDDVWQAVRRLGLEAELTGPDQLSGAVRTLLRPRLSVAGLAASMPQPALAAIIRSTAYRMGSTPERTPAFAALTLSVERRFGRWTVTAPEPDARARPGRTSTMVDALVARLHVRKVEVVLGRRVSHVVPTVEGIRVATTDGEQFPATAVIFTGDPWQLADAVPRPALGRSRRDFQHLEPALAPRVSHRRLDQPCDHVTEVISLTAEGQPTIRFRRPVAGATLESLHDHRNATPDRSAGLAWRGFRSWFRRPRIRTGPPGLFFAGPHTAAGNGLSPTLLAGALASYAAHDFAN